CPIKNTRDAQFCLATLSQRFAQTCQSRNSDHQMLPKSVSFLLNRSGSVRPRHVETERLGGFEAERHCGVTLGSVRCRHQWPIGSPSGASYFRLSSRFSHDMQKPPRGSVEALALSLPKLAWRTVAGGKAPIRSCAGVSSTITATSSRKSA